MEGDSVTLNTGHRQKYVVNNVQELYVEDTQLQLLGA